MKFNIAVLPGDGIGPEISVQGVDVMNAVCEKFGHQVSYEYAICGADAIDKVGDPFPEETFQICKNAVRHIHQDIAPALQGMCVLDQRLSISLPKGR